MSNSIKQYARKYKLDSNELVRRYSQYDSLCREPDYIPPKWKNVRKALEDMGVAFDQPTTPETDGETMPEETTVGDFFALTDVVRPTESSRDALPHPLFVHENVWEMAKGKGEVSDSTVRRLSLVLQHLAAYGKTGVVKGCTGNNNAGWRRSPLGGTNGMQHYLWWAPVGAPPVKELRGEPQAVYIRDIRHHDDHTRLTGGSADDYCPLSAHDLNPAMQGGGAMFEPPWTQGQVAFANSEYPLRVLQGYPGTGKTAALWQAVNLRAGEKVLYLTWNNTLAQKAEQYFEAFAPQESAIKVQTFEDFVSSLCESGAARGYAEAEQEFAALVGRLSAQQGGIWQRHPRTLFEELRAHYVGVRLVRNGNGLPKKFPLCTPDDYRRQRTGILGNTACDSLLRVVRLLENYGPLERFFPDLSAAREAIDLLLANGAVPDKLLGFDRFVVDEAQDLTELELSLICLLARRNAEQRNKRLPFLLFAGDEAQTVRPTDFRWGSMKSLLNDHFQAPQEFPLEHNVRSPRDIGVLVNRVADLYDFLEKDKPKGIGEVEVDDATNARIYHCVVNDDKDLWETLHHLADFPDLPFIAPSGTTPDDFPEEFRSLVRSPDVVKGLDYQGACVLNLGRLLKLLHEEIHENRRDKEFERFWKRKLVDGLRVAVSRATETLVVMDFKPDEVELGHSRQFLEEVETVPVNGAELVEQMSLADLGADELVQMMISDANRNVEVDLNLAIRRARQAVKLLGRAGLPNGVADATLRAEAYETLAKVLMIHYGRAKQADIEALAEVTQLLRKAGRKEPEQLFKKIRDYHQQQEAQRYPLLWEIVRLLPIDGDQSWIRTGLKRDLAEWLNVLSMASKNAKHAFEASNYIEGYLLFLNRNRALDAEKSGILNTWRANAVRTLVGCGHFEQALQLAGQITPPEPLLRAQCLEGLGRHTEAMGLYEQAGDLSGACRAARRIPDINQAVRLMEASGATGAELNALRWMKSLNEIVAAKPQEVHKLLTTEENRFMQDLVKVCRQEAPLSEPQTVSLKLKGAPPKQKHGRR